MGYYKNLTECDWSDGKMVIYQITNTKNGNWYVRILKSIGSGKYYRQSLKTNRKAFAMKLAHETWLRFLVSEELNIPFGKQGFSTVFNEFLKRGGLNTERKKRVEGIFRDYLKPFFGEMDLFKINNKVWRKYLLWRREYWTRKRNEGATLPTYYKDPPTLQCYSREKQIFGQFFKWAAREDYVNKVPVLEPLKNSEGIIGDLDVIGKKQLGIALPMGKLNSIKRKLREYAEENYTDTSTPAGLERTLSKWRLYYFVQICYFSLLRPTSEMEMLDWGHIKVYRSKTIDDAFYGLITHTYGKWKPNSKVGEYRERKAALTYRGVMYLMEWKNKLKELGVQTRPNDPVFPMMDGTRCPTTHISTSFQRRMKDFGERTFKGVNITLYSVRHSAITELVRSSKTLGHISTAASTSIAMISDHYYNEFLDGDKVEGFANRFREGDRVFTPQLESGTMEEALLEAGLVRKRRGKKKPKVKPLRLVTDDEPVKVEDAPIEPKVEERKVKKHQPKRKQWKKRAQKQSDQT